MKQKKRFRFKHIGSLIIETYREWNETDPWRHSAIIAFYAIFSLPALLIIIITVAGVFLGEEAVQGTISEEISEIIGEGAARQIEIMIANSYEQDPSVLATIVGIATLLFGATSMFVQLQKSLNEMWEVKEKPGLGLKKLVLDRLTSFGVILMIGFLLLISFVLTTLLGILRDWMLSVLPEFLLYVFFVLNFLLSFAVIIVLFGLIYKVLPDVKIQWKSVWVGSTITAFLFEVGKFALGIYFGFAEPDSVFGAAGSVILILLWVSYSCLILFFGAEFTKVFSRKYGHEIEPSDKAVRTASYKEKHHL